jgi:hypothetical protein
MVISPGVVGSAYLSKIFDSEPVIATKLFIGVILAGCLNFGVHLILYRLEGMLWIKIPFCPRGQD